MQSMPPPPPGQASAPALLRVVSPSQLDEQDRQQAADAAAAANPAPGTADIASFVRQRWSVFRNHRNSGANSINERLLRAQRMFEGRYDPAKLNEIRKFGGSEVYTRLVAVKCRGATSLLRDVYLGADRPWGIDPQPDPPIPPDVRQSVMQLVAHESASAQMMGQPILPDQVHMRFVDLMRAAQQAARRSAQMQAGAAADKIQGILEEGDFYKALAEFLVDLPLFPYAVLKGPVVRMIPKVTWSGRAPTIEDRPQMFWERVDPFNLYWSPGASHIANSEIIERQRLTRTDLNDLLDLPGYDQAAVRAVLTEYDNGLRDWLDSTDTEAALNVGRESPSLNQSQMIDAIEYHGCIQGSRLLNEGVDSSLIPDPDRDYAVQTWVVGRHTLKTQLNPSPRRRHPYYVTSFEKVPGTVLGHGLTDILEDWQEAANATMRSLINNMAIASGPQVVVNTERLSPSEDADNLYPWKRWHTIDDPMGSQSDPVKFFQPASNAQELIAVYNFITATADDISAIPRYATGESLRGGAGRTASGLSMLMNNSSKVLQTVASNIDIDVMDPALKALYDMIMLTDTSGLLTGDEQVVVNGVTVALQKDTERQKQLQFLQITANPIDAPIVGTVGRARVLRSVAGNMGLPDDIVPDDSTVEQEERTRQQMMMAQGGNGEAGDTPSSGSKASGQQAPQATPAQHSDIAPPVNSFRQVSSRGVGAHG